MVARFESERQALAVMDHPAIAKVFDGGSTAEGRPYFVMEYVAGVPITEHCDTHKLSTAARLALFCEVCEGVQHAHQKAIIHRDLKPSNILVSLVDGKPQPKIIDFGIAKATGYRLTDKTLHTELGALIGTPEYMSPEQADLTGQDIDTRTDVYALGVILYQLLTGELRLFRSLDPEQTRGRELTAREALDRGRERISTLQGEPIVQADLMRAMATSYRGLGLPKTAAELDENALDLRLKAVGPDHPKTLALFHNLSLDYQDLGQFKQAEVLARRALDGKRRILGPDDESTLRSLTALGGVVYQMGRPEEAASLYREALAAYARTKKDGRDVWGAEGNLASVLAETGALQEASKWAEEALAAKRHNLGPDHPDVVYSLQSLASIRSKQGKLPEAVALRSEALDLARRVLGKDHPETLLLESELAVDEAASGERQKAEALYREALAGQQKTLGPNHPSTLDTTNNLAVLLTDLGRFSEADALLKSVESGDRASFGDKDTRTLIAVYNRAALAAAQRNADEAFRILDGAIQHGFTMADEMQADTAWDPLRTDPRFAQALARVRANKAARAAATGQGHSP